MQGALGASGEGGALSHPFLGIGAQLGQGWPLLECAACSQGGELRRMEFHLSEKSPPRPCPASSHRGCRSCPFLPCPVWSGCSWELDYHPALATGRPESGAIRDPGRPLGWGPDKACSAMLLFTVLRATCIFHQIEWSVVVRRGPRSQALPGLKLADQAGL